MRENSRCHLHQRPQVRGPKWIPVGTGQDRAVFEPLLGMAACSASMGISTATAQMLSYSTMSSMLRQTPPYVAYP